MKSEVMSPATIRKLGLEVLAKALDERDVVEN